MQTDYDWLIAGYTAYNAHDIETILAAMHPEIEWTDSLKGGRVHGRQGVREHWTQQWTQIDPHLEPLAIETDEAGRVWVKVHQMIRDLEGNVILDRVIHQVFRIEDGLIKAMELREL